MVSALKSLSFGSNICVISMLASVVVCQGCHSKLPQTRWLEAAVFILSQFWWLEVWDQVSAGLAPSRGSEGETEGCWRLPASLSLLGSEVQFLPLSSYGFLLCQSRCVLTPVRTGEVRVQSCPTLRDPMNCSPPGSSVRGIFQARIQERVACPSPGDFPNPGIEPASPALACRFFTTVPPGNLIRLGEESPNAWRLHLDILNQGRLRRPCFQILNWKC